jgi:hypothetical protein
MSQRQRASRVARALFIALCFAPVCQGSADSYSAAYPHDVAAQPKEGVSNIFILENVGKRGNVHVDIFVRAADEKKKYIGSTESADAQDSALGGFVDKPLPPRRNLAVSKDGRSLVFRHESRFAKGRSKQESGIYLYEYDGGLRRLHTSVGLLNPWIDWTKPIPKDVLDVQIESPILALSADGTESPLAPLGGTALHWAAYEGQTAELDALINAGEPYTTKTRLPQADWLLRLYLGLPPAQWLLGRQMLVVARKG